MNPKYFFAFFLMSVTISYGQTIKIDNGILFNSYRNKLGLEILRPNTTSYSTALGIDFLQKERTYLSSQIGYLQVRGKDSFDMGAGKTDVQEKANYLHLNTTFRYLFLKDKVVDAFIGAGPFVNFLLGDKQLKSSIYKDFYEYNTLYFGGRPEIGISKQLNRFRIDLTGQYMFNLTPSIKSEGIKLNNNTYSLHITLGYKLR
ncbi:hypothetical protein [Emticicia agri]|uniref:Outer membrane protein beta-barrel domain-containing protein n=1 Tax=Emticicia agri TaxID=2492393 RepID=A0A4V1ZDE9_9BACT|nr:hypothetical protein [Emticicia agri]RYU95920.1 hypothetical protein EWM59_09890 [Emticicia agri]